MEAQWLRRNVDRSRRLRFRSSIDRGARAKDAVTRARRTSHSASRHATRSLATAPRLTLAVRRRDYPAMSPAPWQLPWLRINRLARELLKISPASKGWAEVKRELKRCAELRWAVIESGWFN